MNDVTCVILTRGRPQFVRRLARFLRERPEQRFIVADSSRNDDFAQDVKAFADNGLRNSSMLRYDYNMEFYHKLGSALDFVDTPYFYLLADDDFLFSSGVDACVEALKEREELAAAAGKLFVYGAQRTHDALYIPHDLRVYPAKSELAEDPLIRAAQHIARYNATFYSVYRTSLARPAFQAAVSVSANLRIAEIMTSTFVLAAGKRLILDEPMGVRTTHPDAMHHTIPTLKEDLETARYQDELSSILGLLCKRLEKVCTHDPADIRRAIAKVSATYCARVSIDPELADRIGERVIREAHDTGAAVLDNPPFGQQAISIRQHDDIDSAPGDITDAIALCEIAPDGLPPNWNHTGIERKLAAFKNKNLVVDTFSAGV